MQSLPSSVPWLPPSSPSARLRGRLHAHRASATHRADGGVGHRADKSAHLGQRLRHHGHPGSALGRDLHEGDPGITVQVTGGGSGTGIAALINGTTDICESSRPMKDAEKERGPGEARRARRRDQSRSTRSRSTSTRRTPSRRSRSPRSHKITRARRRAGRTWAARTTPIILYGRENNSGTYGYFKEHVLENKDFAASVQTLAGTSAVVNAVKGDQYGIGYGGIAYLEGIRALPVKRTTPRAPSCLRWRPRRAAPTRSAVTSISIRQVPPRARPSGSSTG